MPPEFPKSALFASCLRRFPQIQASIQHGLRPPQKKTNGVRICVSVCVGGAFSYFCEVKTHKHIHIHTYAHTFFTTLKKSSKKSLNFSLKLKKKFTRSVYMCVCAFWHFLPSEKGRNGPYTHMHTPFSQLELWHDFRWPESHFARGWRQKVQKNMPKEASN